MSQVILFNKPYGVLSQFTSDGDVPVLAQYIDQKGFYAAGRLDKDSEGLLVLTNDGRQQARIADPRHKMRKTYWAQVEGDPQENDLDLLRRGITLKDGPSPPAEVQRIHEPDNLWPRTPPVRFRKSVPDAWLKIIISEGRNRQVRRMTAVMGFPTLRLIRAQVGPWRIDNIAPGSWVFA